MSKKTEQAPSLPPPWHFRIGRTMAHVHSVNGFTGISVPYKTPEQRAIADYMLHACNSHDELVNLLLESRYSIGDDWRKCRAAALNKAGVLRLQKLANKLETTQSEILRIAVKRMAVQEGIEQKYEWVPTVVAAEEKAVRPGIVRNP